MKGGFQKYHCEGHHVWCSKHDDFCFSICYINTDTPKPVVSVVKATATKQSYKGVLFFLMHLFVKLEDLFVMMVELDEA